jgi:hypothetical protein
MTYISQATTLNEKAFSPSLRVFDDVMDTNDPDVISDIWRLLKKTQMHIRGDKARKYLSAVMKKVRTILPAHVVNKNIRRTRNSTNMCPETFYIAPKGDRHGWQFRTTNCSYSSPVSDLVSIVINCVKMTQKQVTTLIEGIRGYDRTIHIIAAVPETSKHFQNDTFFKEFVVAPNTPTGSIWNTLIGHVDTTYVLIGRDLEWFNKDGYLDRLVREIERLDVAVAAGAYRTLNGHWHMGCKQSAYVNYRLVYEEGYFESLHECVFCDYIEGPFLMSTKKIQKMQFSKELSQGIFEDFFLRLNNQNLESVVCPDAMFFATKPKLPTTTELLPFLNKWNIYQFSERHSWNHTYPCDKYA